MYANQKTLIQQHLGDELVGSATYCVDAFMLRNIIASRAMHDLCGNAFKVYIYFLCHRKEKTMPFSRQKVCEETGLSSPKSISRAIAELKNKGYIKEEENILYFSPVGFPN